MSITTQIQEAGSITELRGLIHQAETAEDQAAICLREVQLLAEPAQPQLDMLGGSDPRTDIATAFQMATCDASELRWLSEAHLIAYAAARQDECIKIIVRIRAIKGTPSCSPKLRVTRYGRVFQRRAFATGFSAW